MGPIRKVRWLGHVFLYKIKARNRRGRMLGFGGAPHSGAKNQADVIDSS